MTNQIAKLKEKVITQIWNNLNEMIRNKMKAHKKYSKLEAGNHPTLIYKKYDITLWAIII